MARKRLIDPEFWSDEEISKLSDKAKLLFIGLWNFADDSGILEKSPVKIKIQVFPYEPNVKVEELLAELVEMGSIITYKVGKKDYLFIKNFPKYQKGIKFPSFRYPKPKNYPITTPTPPAIQDIYSRRVEKSSDIGSSVKKDFVFPYKNLTKVIRNKLKL